MKITSQSSDADAVRDFIARNPKMDIRSVPKNLLVEYPARFQDIAEAKQCVNIVSKNKTKKKEVFHEKKAEFKRLFWDVETSYNVVRSWNIGYKLTILHENIIKERAIICVCYKWAGESKVHSIEWNKGDDKNLITEFVKILNSADESIGHNSDRYDEKFLRARCIYHRVPMFPYYQTIDTLKLAKSGFRFNSNRLDYLGQYLGFGGKLDTGGFKLWKKIVEENDPQAMAKMVKYCKQDVTLLEKIYDTLNPYTKNKTHVGVHLGQDSCTCPNCGSEDTVLAKTRITAMGIIQKQLQCKSCGKYFAVSNKSFMERLK